MSASSYDFYSNARGCLCRLVLGRYPVESPSSFSEGRIHYFPDSILANAGQSQEN
jgi:hypothetical protein